MLEKLAVAPKRFRCVASDVRVKNTSNARLDKNSNRILATGMLFVLAYMAVGIAGSITLTWLSVGRLPWQAEAPGEVPAWRTFDGFLTVTFGFVFTIGVGLLLQHLLGRGITCPRCGTRNGPGADTCRTCDLRLAHIVDQAGMEDGHDGSQRG